MGKVLKISAGIRVDQILSTKITYELGGLEHKKHPAVNLESSITALRTARSLGRENIPIICIDLNKKEAAYYGLTPMSCSVINWPLTTPNP